jgi:hypothetical protein
MKAQATTTKWSAITVAQQFRWHTMYEAGLNQLRERNTGVCNLTGKTFGELIRHFIVGGDETCMHASAGHTYVIGSTGRKKHEKILHDSRCSITMYRTGSVAGDTGPTIFLMAGERIRSNFNDAMLKRNGAQEGSTIIMTPTAFVTEEAWTKMTPSLVRGLRSMPIVIDNPQWWMLEIFDGFGPHLSSLAAMEIRHDNKILAMKEEGDSSHVNQAYDKFVAKSDKAHKRESLGMLRNAKNVCKGVIDQYGLSNARPPLTSIRFYHPSGTALLQTTRDLLSRSLTVMEALLCNAARIFSHVAMSLFRISRVFALATKWQKSIRIISI